jgi:hypothetical protein
MAFKAQGSVSRLDWDFNPYVAAKGTSPEPSGTAIGDYWADYLSMLRQSQQNVQEMQDKRNAAETVEEKRAIDTEFDEYQKVQAKERIARRIDLLAKLLDNCPTAEQMADLPGRIFDAYEVSVQEELSPKGLTSATES